MCSNNASMDVLVKLGHGVPSMLDWLFGNKGPAQSQLRAKAENG